MYALVDDVPSYPQFLPWCNGAEEHRRTDAQVHATIRIAKGPIRKAFSTINRLTPGQCIELSLVDGPFRRLEGSWGFAPLGDEGCKVSLELDFEFSSRILTATIGPVFNEIANSMVAAFCQRARAVYRF